MNNNKHVFELDQPLSRAIFERSSARFTSYRGFPVFSKPWVIRRTLWVIFWSLLFTYIWFVSVRKLSGGSDVSAGYLLVSACHMAVTFCLAPLVAHFGRKRFFNTEKETLRTLQALGAGMIAALLISSYLEKQIDTLYPEVAQINQGHIQQLRAEAGEGKNYAAKRENKSGDNLTVLVWEIVLILLFGGGYAGLAYVHERGTMSDLAQKHALEVSIADKLNIESKLTVLQAQVEPHFLFNSLASVRALVKQDPERAHASIDALVEYLRATIPQMRAEQDGQALSTVGQQVNIARAYLDVIKNRMGDRLVVHLDLPDWLSKTPFPPLLLISLVENAVKHGAEPNLGRTTIRISVGEVNETQIFVRVSDDGAGLIPQATSGIGLANIRAQIAARFGDAASFNLYQGKAEKGVVGEIIIPIEKAHATNAI